MRDWVDAILLAEYARCTFKCAGAARSVRGDGKYQMGKDMYVCQK